MMFSFAVAVTLDEPSAQETAVVPVLNTTAVMPVGNAVRADEPVAVKLAYEAPGAKPESVALKVPWT